MYNSATMKLALFFMLYGITITVAEQYENNPTFLESKMVGAQSISTPEISEMGKALVSIQVNSRHKWTGSFYQNNFIFTTGACAKEIHTISKLSIPNSHRVCYKIFPIGEHCVPIRSVAISAKYLSFNNEYDMDAVPFSPDDLGILMVNEDLIPEPTRWPWCTAGFLIGGPSVNTYSILGWEFATNLPLRYEKMMPVDVFSHEECLRMYGVDVRNSDISFVVECLKPRVGQLQKEDLGAAVLLNNYAVGILSYIDECGRPAIVSRFKKLPGQGLSDKWLHDDQIDEFYKSVESSQRRKNKSLRLSRR